jgi:hypothetical protein
VANVLPPITIRGVTYRVLRLSGPSTLRYLLRTDRGELFGVYGRNAQAALSAAPLALKLTSDNPLRDVDFFDGDGRLIVRW